MQVGKIQIRKYKSGNYKTEQYKASFETAIDISQFMDYEGKQIPIQILKAGISDEMYEMYPELKEKRVGPSKLNMPFFWR